MKRPFLFGVAGAAAAMLAAGILYLAGVGAYTLIEAHNWAPYRKCISLATYAAPGKMGEELHRCEGIKPK